MSASSSWLSVLVPRVAGLRRSLSSHAAASSGSSSGGGPRIVTAAEVAQHNTDDDCWLIIHGRVYDVSGFVDDHPGGSVLTQEAGGDSTELFEDIGHSDDARQMLDSMYIGELASS